MTVGSVPDCAGTASMRRNTSGVPFADPADGNGRAADAGLSVGDVILQVGDTAVTSPHDVDKAINSSKSNAVLLQIERHGARIFVGIKLA